MNAAIRLFYRLAPMMAVFFAIAAAFAILQKETGWPLQTEAQLTPDREMKISGHGVRAAIEGSARTPQAESRGVLLRDGRPFGTRVYSNKSVKDHGGGRYNIRGHIVWFSGPPGHSPATKGDVAQYSLSVPKRVRATWPALLLFISLGCALAGRRTTGIGRPPSGISTAPRWLTATFGILAGLAVAAVGWNELCENPSFSDGAFSAKGIPYSDAQGWENMARNLAAGHGYTGGFGAQRPFFPVALATAYTTFGDSLATAQGFNLAVLALLAATVFILSSLALGNSTAAIVCTIFLGIATVHREMLHLILTEELATMLGVASLATFWCATVSSGHTGARRPEVRTLLLYVAAGLLFGFSNLARPFSLLAAPLLALVALFASRRPGALTWRWLGRGFWEAAALALGASAVILPWVARQKIVHGIFSLSDSSGTLLYAAAKGRSWGTQDSDEVLASGAKTVAEKDAFFSTRLKETIAEDPIAYIERLIGHISDFPSLEFDLTLPQAGAIASIAVLAAAAGAAWRTRMILPGIVSLGILWPFVGQVTHLPVASLLVVATGIGFWRGTRRERLFLSAILATLAGAAVLCSLIGNFGITRLAGLRDILQIILLANGLRHLATLITNGVVYMLGHERPLPAISLAEKPPLPYLPLGILGLCITACTVIIPKNLSPVPPPAAETLLPDARRAEILEWAQKIIPSASNETLSLRAVDLNDHRAYFAAGEDIGHYASPFEVRDTPRTVAMLRDPVLLGPVPTSFFDTKPDDIPASGRTILVSVPVVDDTAVFGFDPITYEVLALYPLTGDSPPLTFPLSPEAKQALRPTPPEPTPDPQAPSPPPESVSDEGSDGPPTPSYGAPAGSFPQPTPAPASNLEPTSETSLEAPAEEKP